MVCYCCLPSLYFLSHPDPNILAGNTELMSRGDMKKMSKVLEKISDLAAQHFHLQ